MLRVAESGAPGPTRTRAQPVLEEQYEMVVVRSEHAVVERLAVVRIRTRVEQHPRECEGVRMARLVSRPLLAFTERAGQRGERRREPVMQEAGVGIGARVEEQTSGRGDGVDAGIVQAAGVREVEDRLPTMRTALAARGPRVRGEVALDIVDVGARGRDVDALGRE